MRYAAAFAVGALCFVVFPLRGSLAAQVHIPDKSEGYDVTKSDPSQPAPSGFEGRTDISITTAKGNTPATQGNTFTSKFTLGNQIKTCPNADGIVEGTGVFSVSFKSTMRQADGVSTSEVKMRADAKYKGQVGDNGLLEGPVKAEIDYSYTRTGNFRGANGAIATQSQPDFHQHLTIPVTVVQGWKPPDIGAFSGGDPAQAHYAQAVDAGNALTYWGGIYYSIAELKWYGGESGGKGSVRGGQCAQIEFTPPSYTLQPPLGAQAEVTGVLKAKTGEAVKAKFMDLHAFSGMVDLAGGQRDGGSPVKFTYTAPLKKASDAGFTVSAVSRAGTAEAEWKSGLGTGWSGAMNCTYLYTGDQGQNELQTWSNYEASSVTIAFKDGRGTVNTHSEQRGFSVNRQRALRGGAVTYIADTSDSSEASTDDSYDIKVTASINKANGTYDVQFEPVGTHTPPGGKMHSVSCIRENCTESDTPFQGRGLACNAVSGKFEDPNHLQGSINDVKTNRGHSRNGTLTVTQTWNLARSGSK